MRQKRKSPWFMDLRTHRFKLGLSLPISGFYAVLSLMAFGVTPFTVAVAVATVGLSVGALYLADYIGRKLDG